MAELSEKTKAEMLREREREATINQWLAQKRIAAYVDGYKVGRLFFYHTQTDFPSEKLVTDIALALAADKDKEK